MRIIAAIVAISLSSCVLLHEQEADGATRTFAAIGGKGAYDKAQGVAYDNEKSFDTAVITAGTAYTAYQAAKSFAASEATKQGETAASVKKEAIAAKTKRIEGAQALKAKELEMMEVPAP